MKTRYVKNRLKELDKDHAWLAHRIGVKPVTMKQNYLRGITPSKPVAIALKTALNCRWNELLYDEELEELGISEAEQAS